MRDPAFLFYSQDFTTGTQFFSDEQIGKYIRLLCAMHQHGHLPEKHMLTICRTYDKDVLDKFKKDDAGMYYNERLETEVNKRKQYTESRRLNAQHPKKQIDKKVKARAKHMHKHMENENEIENDNNNTILSFENFWNLYDKKVGDLGKIKLKWIDLTEDEKLRAINHIPHYKLSQPDKMYRKHPATYLNNKSFNDEIIFSNGQSSNGQHKPKLNGHSAGVVGTIDDLKEYLNANGISNM